MPSNPPNFPNRTALEVHQCDQLNLLLSEIRPRNRFYSAKFDGLPQKISSLSEWATFPTTTKWELSNHADASGLAPHHTYPLDHYTRLHRTSGSTGRPLMIMDRSEDWDWWLDTWNEILDVAELKAGQAVFMAFSFGPFIGFWSAHDACITRGCRVVPGGGLSTAARIELLQATQCSTLFCTPTYALHLADEAVRRQVDPRALGIRQVFVAGEPGGSILDVRHRIESTFDARVMDHAGATEVGPWGIGTPDGKAIAIIERQFLAEFLPVKETIVTSSQPSESNASPLYELVLTSLGRSGIPALRYRTGDLVRPNFASPAFGSYVRLEGGVLGRVDQMLTIRGINIIPSSIEAILRTFPEVSEYRLIADRYREMDQLTIEVEDRLHQPARIVDLLDRRLGLRIDVAVVPENTLPRSSDKAKRFLDRRPLPKE